ncbi:UDP-N-acetylglucosamine 2-epimerase (non-hydrolyzing) [Aureibaculum marinum]|uniref:UDP-N-acetylglucosamine 2-epimerase (Non-hydrolyzing) n=1 Tax=Aureibaculum marinum TaxID=2487930 RepID=A0A3N4NW34_9FLAO|nr:UDP-N-acetylglucosamine 2-epimerase (non-hydrolyzing) [Aureibaculum marinum]RPE00046.1 UDP-N-acetylglucosamine 2-epimerase (non-hydrolyzing) [Aureibaculum marinum]
MKKIVTILGARPQFVKAAVLSRIIKEYQQIEEVIVHTGQHFDQNMSDVFFYEMEIPKPKYNLHINRLGHAGMTGQMLIGIEKILLKEQPSAVIVYGDTNSTLAGVIAAKKLGIKVIHIEAGLRSFNMNMPEEINRIATDAISDLLLCPTDVGVANLKKEGINSSNKVVKSGDIMKDAVAYYSQMANEKSTLCKDLRLEKDNFVLATIHRQDNTNSISNLKSIFSGLDQISKTCSVIMPLHPRTKIALEANSIKTAVTTIAPVGYFDMLSLLNNCKLVITDSGGLQKESYYNKKHCIIVREETEWIELVENGFAKTVGSNSLKLVEAFDYFKSKTSDFSKNLYGENVGEKMYAEILKQVL